MPPEIFAGQKSPPQLSFNPVGVNVQNGLTIQNGFMNMAQKLALNLGGDLARQRVHTPGKYVVLILFAPVCLVAIGAGLWLNHQERQAAYAAVEFRKNSSGTREAFYALPEFLVDMRADNDGRTAYLRMKASLLLEGESLNRAVRAVDSVKPQLVERMTFFLRQLQPEDFDGSEDMVRLKQEMLRRANLVLEPGTASDVVIEELVIQ